MACRVAITCVLLTLAAATPLAVVDTDAAGTPLTAEAKATKTARCRAMCLDEYNVGYSDSHNACLRNALCVPCWETCSSLHHALDAAHPTACSQLPDCASDGCRRACQFHTSPLAAPPALRAGHRLDMWFGWSEARWALTTTPERGARPVQSDEPSVVFLLLARTTDGWKELVQTPGDSVVLANVRQGTPLRLLALTRLGRLSEVETVYHPTSPPARRGDVEAERLADRGDLRRHAQVADTWLLETVSVARDDNMVLAEISWQSQTAAPAEYLVTWEVSGGGIKGHLYTDMNSATLSLWPEAVYHMQVELTGTRRPWRSVPLAISTYSVAAGERQLARPGLAPGALHGVLLGVALLAALAALALLVHARCRRSADTAALLPGGARRVFAVSQCVKQKTVTSPLVVVMSPGSLTPV